MSPFCRARFDRERHIMPRMTTSRVDVLMKLITGDLVLSREELRTLCDAIEQHLQADTCSRLGRRTLYMPGDSMPGFDDE
jgi:hypothetical protein